jgi:hypothetical protein
VTRGEAWTGGYKRNTGSIMKNIELKECSESETLFSSTQPLDRHIIL